MTSFRHQFDYYNRLEMNRYYCECSRSYKTAKNLAEHKKWECGKLPTFKCDYCGQMFKRKSAKTSHVRKRHFRMFLQTNKLPVDN